MIEQPLVSIVTPCYNGENYIKKFIDSVLNQTYKNIELIIIDDGSTDNTKKIIEQYSEKFFDKKIYFKFFCQKNSGAAGAINKGLKIAKGKYLTWPDSDDFLKEDHIEKMSNFLEKNEDCDIVHCQVNLVNEKGEKISIYTKKNRKNFFFKDLILEKDVFFTGGSYLLRMKKFDEVIPKRQIFESRGGQNYQILLPMLWDNRIGYIDEALYCYYVREKSHSRKKLTFKESLERIDMHERIVLETLNGIIINKLDRKKYLKMSSDKYSKKRFRVAIKYGERIKEYYKKLSLKEKLNFKNNRLILKKLIFKLKKE